MPLRVRTKRRWPSSFSNEWSLAVSVGWVTKRASAARLTLPRRATSRKPSTWTNSIGLVYRLSARIKSRLWRGASPSSNGRLLEPDRARKNEDHGQRGHSRAYVKGRHQADPAAENPSQKRSNRNRAPDDRAHGCIEPALEPHGNDRLAQADLVDVVDAAREEQDKE